MLAPTFAHGRYGTMCGSKVSFELCLWYVVQAVLDETVFSVYDDNPGQYKTTLDHLCTFYAQMGAVNELVNELLFLWNDYLFTLKSGLRH